MNTLPQYSKTIIGNFCFSQEIVCSDGKIRLVTIEEYANGFHAFLTKEDGYKYTNHKGYKTSRKAINAAAKF